MYSISHNTNNNTVIIINNNKNVPIKKIIQIIVTIPLFDRPTFKESFFGTSITLIYKHNRIEDNKVVLIITRPLCNIIDERLNKCIYISVAIIPDIPARNLQELPTFTLKHTYLLTLITFKIIKCLYCCSFVPPLSGGTCYLNSAHIQQRTKP